MPYSSVKAPSNQKVTGFADFLNYNEMQKEVAVYLMCAVISYDKNSPKHSDMAQKRYPTL